MMYWLPWIQKFQSGECLVFVPQSSLGANVCSWFISGFSRCHRHLFEYNLVTLTVVGAAWSPPPGRWSVHRSSGAHSATAGGGLWQICRGFGDNIWSVASLSVKDCQRNYGFYNHWCAWQRTSWTALDPFLGRIYVKETFTLCFSIMHLSCLSIFYPPMRN